MSMNIPALLDELEQSMKQANVWQEVPPTPEQLSSREPFSIDTLTILEWIQWVYIIRLRELLVENRALPKGSSVTPYAEEALKAMGLSLPRLLVALKKLDHALRD